MSKGYHTLNENVSPHNYSENSCLAGPWQFSLIVFLNRHVNSIEPLQSDGRENVRERLAGIRALPGPLAGADAPGTGDVSVRVGLTDD